MEVSKIKPQKNKKRVNIYLDGKFAFPLDADNLLKAGLKVGQELSEVEVESLIFKNEFQKLLDKAYRFISLRPRSEKEVMEYLNKKMETQKRKISKNAKIIGEIVKRLKRQKLIDDSAFALWWVEQRSTFRPRGKMALKMELAQKRIDRELVEQVINEMVDELALAKKAAQKKMKTYRKLDSLEFREKMSAFLARRGFSWEAIKTVIDEISKKR